MTQKWLKSDSKMGSRVWVNFRSLWGRSARVTFESLLGHFNSFWISVELGARWLHNGWNIDRLQFGWRFWIDFPRFYFTAIPLIFFASRCGISGHSRPAILGIVRFAIRDSVPLSSGSTPTPWSGPFWDHGLNPPLSTENPRNKGFSGSGAPIFGFGLADPATKG